MGQGRPRLAHHSPLMMMRGLVDRRPDLADRRNVFVVGTQAGAQRLSAYATSIARHIAEITQVSRAPPVDAANEWVARQKQA
jgi:alkyl hydroperoxide reductase subunit AhpC